ncbi:anti-sigma factor-like protein [Hungatella effluvii]|uniref:Anti-sigma factor-like protein n=2 Tax=Hungatella effluvii TaxID=1096246 RepID=A0A2V3YBT4_9FIRM|nr:anti-sigma factor-like protein [Hungatella effluvii]
MKMGIIIEITGKEAVIMKNGGDFVSLPAKEGWKKGDIVPIKTKQRSRRFLTAAAAIAACLCFVVTGGGYHYYYAQAALISVDVNPSIELSVNRLDRVTSSSALNEDGEALLSSVRLTGMECGEAVKELLQSESGEPYLSGNKNVVVTVYSANEARQSRLLEEIRETADTTVTTLRPDGNTEYRAVTSEEVEAAHSCGVTAGKYIYLQKLEEAAPETDITQYSHCSIDEIKEHISNCENRHQTDYEESGKAGSGSKYSGAEHSDSRHSVTEHLDSEHLDSEHSDSEHSDLERSDLEHSDSEHLDSEQSGSRHSVSEKSNSEQSDSERSRMGHSDSGHSN